MKNHNGSQLYIFSGPTQVDNSLEAALEATINIVSLLMNNIQGRQLCNVITRISDNL